MSVVIEATNCKGGISLTEKTITFHLPDSSAVSLPLGEGGAEKFRQNIRLQIPCEYPHFTLRYGRGTYHHTIRLQLKQALPDSAPLLIDYQTAIRAFKGAGGKA